MQGEGLLEHQDQGHQHHAAADEHARGDGDRGQTPEAAPEDGGAGIAHGGAQHCQIAQNLQIETFQGFDPDQERHAQPAQENADPAVEREPLLPGQEMGQHDAENGGGGIQDGGQAALDVLLAPGDQAERDQVVEQAHDQEGAPQGKICGQPPVGQEAYPQQNDGRQSHPAEDQGEGRDLAHGHLDEEKGAAPDHGQQPKEQPFRKSHGDIHTRQ